MRRHAHFALLPLFALLGSACAQGTVDDVDIERRDPTTISWVAPTLDESILAGDAITLTVSTASADAHRVDFALDGHSIGTCDSDDPMADCHEDNLFSFTTTIAMAGNHTLTASFHTHDGRTVSDERDITVLDAASSPTPVDPGSSPTEPDPMMTPGPTDPSDPLMAGGDPSDPTLYPDIPTDPSETVPDYGVDDLGDTDIGTMPSEVSDGAIGAPGRGYLDPSRGFHNAFNGRRWAIRGQRILLRTSRVFGDVEQVARCMAQYGDDIAQYADRASVSRASIVALAIAGTGCTNPAPRAGAVRAGPMAVRASVCTALNPTLDHNDCMLRMNLVPSASIQTAVRYISSSTMRRLHHNDPIKLAAAYYAGSLRRTRLNAWHLVTPTGYLLRFAQAYNAYRSWEALGRPLPTAP